jgi:hypothetical protein
MQDPDDHPESDQPQPSQAEPNQPEPAAQQAATPEAATPPAPVFALATTGRAGCKACGEKIAKGELRLGEKLHNPYVDADTLYWFHAECAAYRRPESFMAGVQALQAPSVAASPADGSSAASDQPAAETAPIEIPAAWLSIAQSGLAHYRLARVARLEVAPSGRAHCRHCKQPIAKAALRYALTIFQDGRFDPMGFIHFECDAAYFGVRVDLGRAERVATELSPEQRDLVRTLLATAQPSSA